MHHLFIFQVFLWNQSIMCFAPLLSAVFFAPLPFSPHLALWARWEWCTHTGSTENKAMLEHVGFTNNILKMLQNITLPDWFICGQVACACFQQIFPSSCLSASSVHGSIYMVSTHSQWANLCLTQMKSFWCLMICCRTLIMKHGWFFCQCEKCFKVVSSIMSN